MTTASLPIAIGSGDKQKIQQQQQSGHPPRGPPGRRSKLLENKWALRQCTLCRENFIPSTHDSEFCSGDCRLSFAILEQSRSALKK